jgi:hypothetical protein
MSERIFDRIGTGHDKEEVVCKRRWVFNQDEMLKEKDPPLAAGVKNISCGILPTLLFTFAS